MGCTSSSHLGKHASMKKCPSPPARATPPHANMHGTDYSIEYHRHFVALTSSSYGLLNVAPPSKPAESNTSEKNGVGSLNEMYGKLRSLELSESAHIQSLCNSFKSPLGRDASCSLSAHGWHIDPLTVKSPLGGDVSHLPSSARGWRINSAEFVVSETINVREMMMEFEEEAFPQGLSHLPPRQASSIVLSPAQREALASRQPKKKLEKSFHTVEDVDKLKKSCKVILDEDGYDSGKENTLPEHGHHTILAPSASVMPLRCPFGNTPLSRNSQSSLKSKEAAQEGGLPSVVRSGSKMSTPSTSQAMKNAASKNGKVEPAALCSRQHQKRSAASCTPISGSSTSVSRRVVLRENISSTEPSSPLFDPDMVASYEKALSSVSEDNWNACLVDSPVVDLRRTHAAFHKEQKYALLGCGQSMLLEGVVQKPYEPFACFEERCPPGGERTLVLYTTTLRGIRKTFEDCNRMRSILQSYGLSIDERDVSMHLEFLNELRGLMDRVLSVPRLFIKGRYIGGIEEVAKLYEDSKLDELVERLPREVNGGNCDGCGGIRFVPCLECSGSCKIRCEDNKVERCTDCNENGLIQCPICT